MLSLLPDTFFCDAASFKAFLIHHLEAYFQNILGLGKTLSCFRSFQISICSLLMLCLPEESGNELVWNHMCAEPLNGLRE